MRWQSRCRRIWKNCWRSRHEGFPDEGSMMTVLFAGMVEGAIAGGIAGAVVGVVAWAFMALFGPKRQCPECAKKLPMPLVRPLKNCPHCGCELPPPGKKK